MSSELEIPAYLFTGGADHFLGSDYDPVMSTAGDRPNTDTLPALIDPTADHLDPDLAARRGDVDIKHARVSAFLDAYQLDGIVLGRADSVSWFTSGGDLGVDLGGDAASVLIFITRTARVVIADNVQSARVFEEELAGLGFQLKERPWYGEPARVVLELGRNKRLASDLGIPAPWNATSEDSAERIRTLRWPLTKLERQRYRELGRTLTQAVEATCRNFQPGESEADLAGHLAHRLFREGVVPVDLKVASDGRLARYRQPTFKAAPIARRATIAAIGRRHGLCAAVTRTVSFGPVESEFRASHSLASMVDATFIYFSRPGQTVGEVFARAKRIYEKFGHGHEWTLDYQGWQIGHSPRERALRPDSMQVIEPGMAFHWSPSVASARCEDTFVVDERGFEVVTEAQNWPKIDVTVKGFLLPRPGILER